MNFFRQMPPVVIPPEIMALSDANLEVELINTADNLECGADHVAEIESEMAGFGDGPPGSYKFISDYRADEAHLRKLQAERDRRHPRVVSAPRDEDGVPF